VALVLMSLNLLSEPSETDVDLNAVLHRCLSLSMTYTDASSLSLPCLKGPRFEDHQGLAFLASSSVFSREDVLLAKQYLMPKETWASTFSTALRNPYWTSSLFTVLVEVAPRLGVFPKTLLISGPKHGCPGSLDFAMSVFIPTVMMQIGHPQKQPHP
jgi:hypothetical protein